MDKCQGTDWSTRKGLRGPWEGAVTEQTKCTVDGDKSNSTEMVRPCQAVVA